MNGEETPALSVVIPVYNEGENVAPTLRGVVEQSHVRPLEVLVVHDFDPADVRAIGEIDRDEEFVFGVEPHECDQVGLIGIAQPDYALVAEGGDPIFAWGSSRDPEGCTRP